jgi:NAD(P)H-dependent FMN reductase
MENIPHDWFFPEMYQKGKQAKSLRELQDKYILPADKFVYVISEYNGGFPGAIKIFLDGCSVRKLNESFQDKKAALVGVATGRAGNLRGMDHLAGVLNHLGTVVLPNKVPISRIKSLMDKEGKVVDENTVKTLTSQARELLAL